MLHEFPFIPYIHALSSAYIYNNMCNVAVLLHRPTSGVCARCRAGVVDAEEYAAADSALLAIDARGLKPGSRQQSRYALLYTQTQYKQYIVAPNDSLINIAVDYAEAKGDDADRFYAYLYQGIVRYDLGDYSQAAHSLFRAMSNADECLEL